MKLKLRLRKSNLIKGFKGKGRLLFSLFFVLFLVSCDQKPEPQASNESSEYKKIPNPYGVYVWSLNEAEALLQAGDILLKCGKGHISNMVLIILQEEIPISHCAIVLPGAKRELVHSVSHVVADLDGVQRVSLEKFLSDMREDSFYALRHKDTAVTKKFAEIAAKQLLKPKPFDHAYNMLDTNELYCSEFVDFVFKNSIGKTYFGTKRFEQLDVLSFNPLIHSKDFKILNKN